MGRARSRWAAYERCNGAATLRAGFTLTELLVATAILLIFGAMAVATLRYGTTLWRSCQSRSHAYEVATNVFHQLEADLRDAKSQFWAQDADAYDTRIKFYVDHDQFVNGANRWYRYRLRFVRGIPDDTLNPRLRQAGDGIDNDGDGGIDEESYNLKDDDGDGLVDEDLKPLEGMCEVAYLMGLDGNAGSPAYDAHTLYRAVLAPIGDQTTSLFNNSNLDGAQKIKNRAEVLARGILYFGIMCWTQYTTTWDTKVGFRPWRNSYTAPPEGCGPTLLGWDSDRLSSSASEPSPAFEMDPGGKYFYRDQGDDDGDGTYNDEDPDYVRDNVFPRAIKVELVVDPTVEYPQQNPLRLAEDITASHGTIRVIGTPPAYNKYWPFLFIEDPVNGDEWVRFSDFTPSATGGEFTVYDDPNTLSTADGRGKMATTAVQHPRGCLVKFGYRFTRVFYNPAGRDYWGQ